MDSKVKETTTGLITNIRYRFDFAGRRRICALRPDDEVEKQAASAEALIDFSCHFL
jgi:hypothetical protein